MKLCDFDKHFPDEETCKMKFRELRMQQGIICPKCGCAHHYWKSSKEQFQCAKCGHRMGLRTGTIMQASKLPFRYWFMAMHLITATKQSFSSAEIQRQLGHKRYQPIWEMMHKIRSVMGIRDSRYTLSGAMEIDEAFFTTETPAEKKGRMLKAGAGSERKAKVLVMAESKLVENPKPNMKSKKVGYIKMSVIPNLKAKTIGDVVTRSVNGKGSTVVTDASKSHSMFKDIFKEHQSQVVEPEDIGKILPWVHVAIANAKSTIECIHHGVKAEFLQEYLNEFCYKFNRRYLMDSLFDKLLSLSAECRTKFVHRVYNSKILVVKAA